MLQVFLSLYARKPISDKHTSNRVARKPAIAPYQKTSECVGYLVVAKCQETKTLTTTKTPIAARRSVLFSAMQLPHQFSALPAAFHSLSNLLG
jgi:hypothetical protein